MKNLQKLIATSLLMLFVATVVVIGQSQIGSIFTAQRFRVKIQSSTPTTLLPASTQFDLIAKSDGIYFLNSAGVAVKLNDSTTASPGSFTTLAASGNFAINTNKFTVAGTSGNTVIAGTLGLTSDLAINTNKFTVTASSGNTVVAGTLGVTSDVAVNTNKFNVTASSGNTTVAGTLGVTGVVTPTGGVAAAGGFSVSPANFAVGGRPAFASTDGTDATPVSTEVYIGEIFIPANTTITGVATMNGTVASGNLKVGLANSSGAVVATSASTAMSGTDTYQRVAFTSTYAAKGPATYYVLLFIDNGTARYNAHPFGNFGAAKQTGQTFATGFTTITPPTTFTADLAPIASLY